MSPVDRQGGESERGDDLARHLSFFVPAGFLLMKQAEADRIHNETEALRIERDSARASIDRLDALLAKATAMAKTDEQREACDALRRALADPGGS